MEAPTTRTRRVAEGLDFEAFFRAEFPRLVRALYLLVADRVEAEELAQDAMARTFERWDRVSAMESPGGYVYRVAVNLNRRRLRHLGVRARKLLRVRAADSVPPPGPGPEIEEALDGLSRGQREAFLLVEWVGMSSEEAGRILGIAPASVRSRIHRARETLRERLGSEEGRAHG